MVSVCSAQQRLVYHVPHGLPTRCPRRDARGGGGGGAREVRKLQLKILVLMILGLDSDSRVSCGEQPPARI